MVEKMRNAIKLYHAILISTPFIDIACFSLGSLAAVAFIVALISLWEITLTTAYNERFTFLQVPSILLKYAKRQFFRNKSYVLWNI